MNYTVLLRLQLQEEKWITMGENHTIPWDMRDLIVASSGWAVLNQESAGQASALVPKLEKGDIGIDTKSISLYSIRGFTWNWFHP